MSNELISSTKQKMTNAVSHLRSNFATLQAGRASAALVEDLMIASYGTKTPLKGLATISTPDSATLSIQPWDRKILGDIEKAINESGLGLNAQNDGIVIRIIIAKPTEEKRKELVKLVNTYAEEARISVRTARQETHNKAKSLKETGDMTEDDFFRTDKELQRSVDEFNAEIEKLATQKEHEIMTV